MRHVRSGEEREWSTFPIEASARSLHVAFEFEPDDDPKSLTLRLKQVDVKQRWDVTINGQTIGQLIRHEEPLICQFDVPMERLVRGKNELSIACKKEAESDDIRVGQIELFQSDISTLHSATISTEVSDTETERPLPARITITDQDGTLVPVTLKHASDRHAVRSGVIYTASGRAEFQVTPGDYWIHASRGFEYTMHRVSVQASSNETKQCKLSIRRIVDTSGWVACDTHVHTFTHSRHGDASINERMVTLAGEAVELPIATDHNLHIDYRNAIEETETEGLFTPVIGNEVTTRLGHFNVFPVASSKVVLPDHQSETWKKLFESIFATPNVSIAVLNHARDVHGGFRPFAPKHHLSVSGENLDDWALKANAMEVLNSGATQTDPLELFNDWCGLVNHGVDITPVGCSDSHDVSRYIVGQARTYIQCNDSDPGNINVAEAVSAFKKSQVIVSYGLLADVQIGDAHPGDLIRTDEVNEVDVQIKGPAWTNVKTIHLLLNGSVLDSVEIENQKSKNSGVLAKHVFQLKKSQLPGDSWVSVLALGDAIRSPHWRTAKPYQPDSPVFDGHTFSCSGPIWIDVDGDGYQSPADQAKRIVTTSQSRNELAQALSKTSRAVVTQTLAILRNLHDDDKLKLDLFSGDFARLVDQLPRSQRSSALRYRDELRNSIIARAETTSNN